MYRCGVRSLRVVLQDSGQAEVWHFTHQIAVDQDVSSCQVSVNVAHVWQILHARGDATQHANQLDDSEVTIMLLTGRAGEKSTEEKPLQKPEIFIEGENAGSLLTGQYSVNMVPLLASWEPKQRQMPARL